MSSFISKKSVFSGLGASMFHIFCCGAPVLLFFLGLQAINIYLFLDNNRIALWVLTLTFSALSLFLNYRKTALHENRSRMEKSFYLFSWSTALMFVVLLYMSYSTAPYVLPLVKNS